MTPIPENVDGIIYVATNKAIRIGIEGTDMILFKDVGGYYIVHKEDMSLLLKINKKYKEAAEKNDGLLKVPGTN